MRFAPRFAEFLVQLGVFGLIAGALLVLNVAQRWLGEMSKVKLREGLVQDLVRNWMLARPRFRLAHAGPIGVNPDQRMHEDARHLTELSADLAIGLLQASILLGHVHQACCGRISKSIRVSHRRARHRDSRLHGLGGGPLFGSASLLSYWVGREPRRPQRGSLRARGGFALFAGAHQRSYRRDRPRRRRGGRSAAHRGSTSRRARGDAPLVMGLTNLTWVTAGSGWFTIVAPIIAAAPLYFAGKISSAA
jgi:vitamin B12/bleomycin/antimicrobial peptide transport system ATP-binding/permease protein